MPTSPTLPLPVSAAPVEHAATPSTAPTKGGNDDFHKALGDARGGAKHGATQDSTAGSKHAATDGQTHAGRSDDTQRAKHDARKDEDADDHKTAAAGIAAFPPGLELRPVLAAGSGKSLPVGLGADKAPASGRGQKNGIHTLLQQLESAASGKPADPSGASAITADSGAASGARTDKTLLTLDAMVKAGRPDRDGAKTDRAAGAIDAAHAGLAAPGPQPGPANAQPAAVHQLQIPSAPASPQFAQSLSQHVAWLGAQDVKQAVIHLHPRDLGPINVNVQVTHNQVDVSFAVQHPATVHALQQTLPQLDTLLAQQGLNLGQTQVGQQHNPQQQASHGHGGAGHDAQADTGADIAIEAPVSVRPLAIGLVDDFA